MVVPFLRRRHWDPLADGHARDREETCSSGSDPTVPSCGALGAGANWHVVAIDPKFRTFADACTAPDHPHIRSPEHYVDLPRSAKGIEVAHPCPVADRCVISAILNDTRDLALSLDVSDQLRLLKSVGHWVGDVHQPLHVSFDDDRGGNLVAIEGSCSKANLHAVWDRCIIEKKIGLDYAVIAAKLRAEIIEEDRARWIPPTIDVAAVVAWANKSSAIAEQPDVQYCVQVADSCWYAWDQPEYKGGAQRVVVVDDRLSHRPGRNSPAAAQDGRGEAGSDPQHGADAGF